MEEISISRITQWIGILILSLWGIVFLSYWISGLKALIEDLRNDQFSVEREDLRTLKTNEVVMAVEEYDYSSGVEMDISFDGWGS